MKITAVAAREPGVSPPAIEAPYVMEHDGYWYLFVSWDNCCDGANSTYKIVVGRSKSLLGPYVDYRGRAMSDGGGTLVLASYGKWRGPGHNSVLSTARGDWMVNAGYNTEHLSRGRMLQIRPMYWLEDRWPVVGETIGAPQQPGQAAGRQPSVAGDWTQWIDYAAPAVLTLRGDGRVSWGDQAGSWQLHGGTLAITWSETAAARSNAGKLALKVQGNCYVGRNAKGQIVFGLKK